MFLIDTRDIFVFGISYKVNLTSERESVILSYKKLLGGANE